MVLILEVDILKVITLFLSFDHFWNHQISHKIQVKGQVYSEGMVMAKVQNY